MRLFFEILFSAIAITVIIILFFLLKKKILLDEETLNQNQILREINKNLTLQKESSENEINVLKEEKNNLLAIRDQNYKSLENFQEEKDQKFKEIETMFQNNVIMAQSNFDNIVDSLNDKIESYKLNLDKEQKDIIDSAMSEYKIISKDLENQREELDRLKGLVWAAVENNKRVAEINRESSKYRINIDPEQIIEITLFREILPKIKEKRPVNKMIWEAYYRDKATSLLDRIIPKEKGTGIYKITNTLNHMVYIGQAVNLSDRLKTHIKCGLGIDANNSELYKAMQTSGIENFSFEIVEFCKANELNDREKFWIDYFHSNDYGYNQTKGGAISR